MIADLPEPDGALLAWLSRNPDVVRDAMRGLKKLGAMEVRLSTGVSAPSAGVRLTEAEGKAMLALPLVFRQSLPDVATYSANADAGYTEAQIQALMDQVTSLTNTVNKLLARLRETGQNPS